MPWHVQSDHPSCPISKPFGVVQGHTGDDGPLEGCHPTRDAANKQLAALYASEADMNKGRSAPADVHAESGADVANESDIVFLHNIEVSLNGSIEHANAHAGSGSHAEVMALAQDVAATHGSQMAKAGALKARLTDGGGGGGAVAGGGGGGGSNKAASGPSRARTSTRTAAVVETRKPAIAGDVRSVPFELGKTRDDGLTFEGYAAVFNSPTRINSRFEGEFDEVIMPGAFRRSLAAKTPVLMFDHGQHPLLGAMPLGVITRAEEDSNGLFIEARLTDNWLIQPVRDAVRDGAVDGMSFRFSVNKDGEKWQTRSGDVQLRTIHSFDAVPELGPVVFPAYEPTTASVRSRLDELESAVGAVPRQGVSRDRAADLVKALITDGMTVEQLIDLTKRTARGAAGGESSSGGPSSGRRADVTARDLARAADMRRIDVRRFRSS